MAASEGDEIRVVLEQDGDYAFRVRFDGTTLAQLHTDEPEPLGGGSGPNPSRLLIASVANCLSASLLFALRKFRNRPAPLTAVATARTQRNEAGRWRIPRIEVTLTLGDGADGYEHLDRILEQFEDFCVVTQSVRAGVDVAVRVQDANGRVLAADASP